MGSSHTPTSTDTPHSLSPGCCPPLPPSSSSAVNPSDPLDCEATGLLRRTFMEFGTLRGFNIGRGVRRRDFYQDQRARKPASTKQDKRQDSRNMPLLPSPPTRTTEANERAPARQDSSKTTFPASAPPRSFPPRLTYPWHQPRKSPQRNIIALLVHTLYCTAVCGIAQLTHTIFLELNAPPQRPI